jgi:hypothetical protein
MNMTGMFRNATSFNHPSIKQLKLDSLVSMSHMFEGAIAFNQLLHEHWSPRNLIHMNDMFKGTDTYDEEERRKIEDKLQRIVNQV